MRKLSTPIRALMEAGFRLSSASASLEGAVIFSATKSSAQLFTAALAKRTHCGKSHDRDQNHTTDDKCRCIHTNRPHFLAKLLGAARDSSTSAEQIILQRKGCRLFHCGHSGHFTFPGEDKHSKSAVADLRADKPFDVNVMEQTAGAANW